MKYQKPFGAMSAEKLSTSRINHPLFYCAKFLCGVLIPTFYSIAVAFMIVLLLLEAVQANAEMHAIISQIVFIAVLALPMIVLLTYVIGRLLMMLAWTKFTLPLLFILASVFPTLFYILACRILKN